MLMAEVDACGFRYRTGDVEMMKSCFFLLLHSRPVALYDCEWERFEIFSLSSVSAVYRNLFSNFQRKAATQYCFVCCVSPLNAFDASVNRAKMLNMNLWHTQTTTFAVSAHNIEQQTFNRIYVWSIGNSHTQHTTNPSSPPPSPIHSQPSDL